MAKEKINFEDEQVRLMLSTHYVPHSGSGREETVAGCQAGYRTCDR